MDLKIALPIAGFILAIFVFLHQLITKRKEATIEGLEKEVARLTRLLAEAKENSPEVLAERYKKKIDRQEVELKELLNEHEINSILISEKEESIKETQNEISQLKEQMVNAQKLLNDLENKIDVCPHCHSALSTLDRSIFINEELEEYGIAKSYTCGYAEFDGDLRQPCPLDPRFPKLNEYNLITEYDDDFYQWNCKAVPITPMAKLFNVFLGTGNTETEAKEDLINRYNGYVNHIKKQTL